MPSMLFFFIFSIYLLYAQYPPLNWTGDKFRVFWFDIFAAHFRGDCRQQTLWCVWAFFKHFITSSVHVFGSQACWLEWHVILEGPGRRIKTFLAQFWDHLLSYFPLRTSSEPEKLALLREVVRDYQDNAKRTSQEKMLMQWVSFIQQISPTLLWQHVKQHINRYTLRCTHYGLPTDLRATQDTFYPLLETRQLSLLI